MEKLARCYKCESEKPLSEFYGVTLSSMRGKCKDCAKKDSKETYRKNRDQRLKYERERNERPERKQQLKEAARRMREKYPERYKARTAVGNALRDGRLKRQPCVKCGTRKRVHAHHEDYSKPLDVIWMCRDHHREHHESRGEEVDWDG